MTIQDTQQLVEMNRLILRMASSSEEMVADALDALREQDIIRAKAVIYRDAELDQMEVEINCYVFTFLALRQPVAGDLRFVLAAQKIANDIERIGDHAVNIAEAAILLSDTPLIKPLINIPRMANVAREMLKCAIDSFVYRDDKIAVEVRSRDDEMDALDALVKENLSAIVEAHPEHFRRAVRMIGISTDLERIADLATNIAEEVVFIRNADVLKHKEPAAQRTIASIEGRDPRPDAASEPLTNPISVQRRRVL